MGSSPFYSPEQYRTGYFSLAAFCNYRIQDARCTMQDKSGCMIHDARFMIYLESHPPLYKPWWLSLASFWNSANRFS